MVFSSISSHSVSNNTILKTQHFRGRLGDVLGETCDTEQGKFFHKSNNPHKVVKLDLHHYPSSKWG